MRYNRAWRIVRRVAQFKNKACLLCCIEYVPTSGKQKVCVSCSKKYWRLKHSEQARNRARVRKIEAIKYLGGMCYDCGKEFHQSVYEFHHLNPNEKENDGSEFLQRRKELMYKELDKCVLLCANCHRIRHHNYEEIHGV